MNITNQWSLILSAFALCGIQGKAQANILQNGSFETGDFSGWNASGNLEVSAPEVIGQTAPPGVYWVQFNAHNLPPTGVLSQTFATTPGAMYVLTFDYANFGGLPENQTLDINLTGVSTLLATTATSPPSVPVHDPLNFGHFTDDFIADSTSTTLQFTDDPANNSINQDGILDNIAVVETLAPVPEPSTIIAGALMLLPFGSSAFRQLRKKLHAA